MNIHGETIPTHDLPAGRQPVSFPSVCAKIRGAEPIRIPIAIEIQAEAAHVQCSLGNGEQRRKDAGG